jgi:hypothetical protein
MKKIILAVLTMNLAFSLLAGANAQAGITCNIENREEKLGVKIWVAVMEQIAALKETKGIVALPGTINVKVENTGYVDHSGVAPLTPLMRVTGNFTSERGTKFKIMTGGGYPDASIQFDPYLHSRESDVEGNVVDGECYMRAQASLLVVNADSELTLAEFSIPKLIEVK